MKKIIQNLILGVVILVGIIVSLANAANDYGLRSNNLHSHILAQSTENGTSTNGLREELSSTDLKLLKLLKNIIVIPIRTVY